MRVLRLRSGSRLWILRGRAGVGDGGGALLAAATSPQGGAEGGEISLLARIFELRPLTCPRCYGEMRLIAFLTEPAPICAVLAHLSEPTTPPRHAPRARAPSELDAGARRAGAVRGTDWREAGRHLYLAM